MEFLITHSIANYKGIGTLRVRRANEPTGEKIVVLHGLDSSKEGMLKPIYYLANAGFDVYGVDLAMHGDRTDANTLHEMLENSYVPTVWNIVHSTANDLLPLCSELSIDPTRSGFLGISLGGLIGHTLMLGSVKFKSCVFGISTPDWLKIEPEHNPPKGSFMWDQVNIYNPINYPEKYLPSSVLMINGDCDQRIPHQGSVDLFAKLSPLYAAESRSDEVGLLIYQGADHFFNDKMLGEAIEWFKKYLG